MASNVQFLAVILLHLCIASSSLYLDPSRREQEHDYLRFADVNRHCQPVLSSAKELCDTNRPYVLMRELSFQKGDWRQDAGEAPLVPFDAGEELKKGAGRLPDPLSLATFVVTHVEEEEEEHPATARAAVNVSGVLVLTIYRKSAAWEFSSYIPAVSPEFNLSAGQTRLKIIFEGVYTETAQSDGDDGGERVLCMVGSAVLPKRSAGGVDPWDWAKKKNSGRSSFQPPVTADNNILLVLRYPKKLTLATRAALGTMRSTSAASDASYFDAVQLVSGLASKNYFGYQFRPEELVLLGDADDGLSSRTRDVYNGSYPCDVLGRYAHAQVLAVLPGWQCNSSEATGEWCHGLGPFDTGQVVDADADELAGVRIIMQDRWCGWHARKGTAGRLIVSVSVVLRALLPWEHWATAMPRSGLSGMTLSAEGLWNASTGQACMVACRGIAAKEACHFQVCFNFPTTMSITSRATMLGRITMLGGVEAPLLSFQRHMYPPRFWKYHADNGAPLAPYKYNYTKVKQAGELRRRSESPLDFIAKSLHLSYPKRGGADDDRRTLAHRLTLCFKTVPSVFRQEWIEHPNLQLEIFFLDQIIPIQGDSGTSSGILNVSAELTIYEHGWPQKSVMSLEGVYNPDDGRMHLIGCRDVRLPQQNTSANRDLQLQLQEGMDCSIEVKVEYPPTTMYWFIMLTAKVQIASTRTAVDPLHFSAVKLRALPILYPQQQRSEFYQGVVDGVLNIVLQSATIVAVLSQLRHIKSRPDVAPYVSLLMLFLHGERYGMPLFTIIEAILAKVVTLIYSGDIVEAPSSGRTPPYYRFDSGRLCETIDQAAQVLALCVFVLTLRLNHNVLRARARMVERSRVPRERMVFVYHCGVHLVLSVIMLALNGEAMTVDQHISLTEDLFLLPQVIGNALWRVNCRPLKRSFYVGITAVRLLPHLYEYAPPDVIYARYSGEQQFVDAGGQGRFFARPGDAVIPLAAVTLVLVVYAQQRWNYAIVSRMGKPEQKKLEHTL